MTNIIALLKNKSCNISGASPSGKAAGFDPAIRRFESFCPSFYRKNIESSPIWKGDRVADGIALLMRRTFLCTGGSNPPLSVIIFILKPT